MKRRIFTLILAFLCLSLTLPASALDLSSTQKICANNPIQSVNFKDAAAFLNGSPLAENRSTNIVTIDDFTMVLLEDEVTVSLQAADGSQFELIGHIYPMLGNGFYDGKLVLGDFSSSSENYNPIFFKIQKECDLHTLYGQFETLCGKNAIIFALENMSDGSVELYTLEITDQQFKTIYEVAKNVYNSNVIDETSYFEFSEKVLNLYSINNHWKSDSNAHMTLAASASDTRFIDSFTTNNSGISISYGTLANVWNELFYNPNNETEVKLSSILGSVFQQEGWKFYNNSSSSAPWFYIMYSFNNGESNMIEMTVATYSESEEMDEANQVGAHLTIQGSLAMEYCIDYLPGTLRLLYYDMGPALTDCYLNVGHLGGEETFFRRAEVAWSLADKKTPWKNILFSHIPFGSDILEIWDWLTSSSYDSDWAKGFDYTLESQLQSYGGLVKDICVRADGNKLRGESKYLDILGTIVGPYESHDTNFMFTAQRY